MQALHQQVPDSHGLTPRPHPRLLRRVHGAGLQRKGLGLVDRQDRAARCLEWRSVAPSPRGRPEAAGTSPENLTPIREGGSSLLIRGL